MHEKEINNMSIMWTTNIKHLKTIKTCPRTTWDSLEQEMEPSKSLPVTYSPQTNEENLNGRYPWKFMGKPKGPAYSNTNDVYEMIKGNKRIAKKDKVAFAAGWWIAPDGTFFSLPHHTTHYEWILNNKEILKQKGFQSVKTDSDLIEKGWIRGLELTGTQGNYALNVQDLSRISSVLVDFIVSHSFKKFVLLEDELGRHFQITEDDIQNLEKRITQKVKKHADSCYTDQQMEDIYTKQHEYSDSDGGGNVYHDFNNSTTDYPKPEDLEVYKVRLDLLQKPIDRKTPMMPDYSVVWYESLPAGEYNGDY